MLFKHVYYVVGITSHIVSIIILPIPRPIDLDIITHPSKRDLEGIFARSPEDVVPVEECKRALAAAPIFDAALYRRCSGEGEGEGEDGADDGSGESDDGGTSGNDNDNGDADETQIASNSPRQDCILSEMELFPQPALGLCESLPDTPPTPNPAPPVIPVPAPVTPQPAPPSVPQPVGKHVPVDADSPARMIPKRAIEDHGLEGLLARSPCLDDEDPACEDFERSLNSNSPAEIRRRYDGGAGGDDEGEDESGDEGEGAGEGDDGGEGNNGDTGSEGSGGDHFSDLDGEQLAALDLPGKWNDKWFCYAWIAVGALPDVGCDMFRITLPLPNLGPPAPAPPALPVSPPSAPSPPRKASGGKRL